MAVTGVEARIYDGLAAYLMSLMFDPPMKIAMPGISFAPPIAEVDDPAAGVKKGMRLPYLVASYMPNTARLDGLAFDSDVTHEGLFQISVFWPSRQGLVRPMQLASQVVAAFPPGLQIESNGITLHIDRRPEIAPPLTESDLIHLPVTIRWRAGVAAGA